MRVGIKKAGDRQPQCASHLQRIGFKRAQHETQVCCAAGQASEPQCRQQQKGFNTPRDAKSLCRGQLRSG